MVWQPELFNILNLGSEILIKLGTSMYNDVITWAEAYLVTWKSALLVFLSTNQASFNWNKVS